MSTQAEIAERALRKLKVIGATETATAEDLALAVQAVTDAHNVLAGMGLLRWAEDDIPAEADLGYVLMAAYLMAPDFTQPQQPEWMAQGVGIVQNVVYLPMTGTVSAEDF
jgi:hypothetical protein